MVPFVGLDEGGKGVAYFVFVSAWGTGGFSFAVGAGGLSGSEWFRGNCI